MESLTSFQQYPVVNDNECQDYHEYLSKYNTNDSILKDDNQIDFEIVRNNTRETEIENRINNKNFINNNISINDKNNNNNDIYNSNTYINSNIEYIDNNWNKALQLDNQQSLYRDDSLSSKENPSDIIDFVLVQNNMGSNVSRNSSKNQQTETSNRPRRRTHSSGDIHSHKYNNRNHKNFLDLTSTTTTTTPSDIKEKLNTLPTSGNGQNPILNLNNAFFNATTTNGTGIGDSNQTINNCTTDGRNDLLSQNHENKKDKILNQYFNRYNVHKQHHKVYGFNRSVTPSLLINDTTTTTTTSTTSTSIGGVCSAIIPTATSNVTYEDRNKFRGSLPNHLDFDTFVNHNDDIILQQYRYHQKLLVKQQQQQQQQQQQRQQQQHQQQQQQSTITTGGVVINLNNQQHHHHHHHNSQSEEPNTTATVIVTTSTTVTTSSTVTGASRQDSVEYVTVPSSNNKNHQLIHQNYNQQVNHFSSYNIGGSNGTVANCDGITGNDSNSSGSIVSGSTSNNCEKENSASTSSSGNSNNNNENGNVIGNTSKIKQVKPDLQLTLPITRTNFDPSCDQGYGSERSPEDELPPLLSNFNTKEFQKQHQHPTMMMSEYSINNGNNGNECCEDGNEFVYDFITEDCTFTVQIVKGSRGLGFSICGGVDTNTAFPGLIRIKRLFPHQAAWSTGKLQTGDIILESNGIPLTGLTNYEALEVLRTLPNDVELLICRPVDEQYKKLSPPTEPPKPPQRTQQQSIQTQTALEDMGVLMPYQQQQQQQQFINATQYLSDAAAVAAAAYSTTAIIPTNCYGEFEIFMIKQQGSLGFTIHKEDESILGHYVRALVREPATTDGRIKPGDKIVAVNDIPLSPMTHEQAVIFLRQSGDVVKLRLYRDEPNTPEEPPSPTVTERENSFGGSSSSHKKPHLRPEAINLLTDLAHKKQNSQGDSTESSNLSTSSSPRRLKRGYKSQSEQDASDSKSSNSNPVYLVSSQTTTLCSDSEQSIDSQCSYIIQPGDNVNEVVSPSGKCNRPNYLDLSNSNSSDGNTIRKAKYQFGVCPNTYELNNLDNDELDAPIRHHHHPHHNQHHQHHHQYNRSNSNNLNNKNLNSIPPSSNNEFNSLPCDVLLGSSTKYSESEFSNDDVDQNIGNSINNIICHKNPLYQSVNVQNQLQLENNFENSQSELKNSTNAQGNESLLKWKGTVLSAAEDDDENKQNENKNENSQRCNNIANTNTNITANITTTTDILTTDGSIDGENSTTFTLTLASRENSNIETDTVDGVPSNSKDDKKKQQLFNCGEGYKIVSVELNRGWNSRLGFSLQPSKEFQNKSYISAIYNDSVAARDGRLRVGDILVSVNEESIENMSTTEIIDFLRIIRGAILITVLRKDSTSQEQSKQ
ncbi:putative uncharacterized protein DDB_G0282133 isoform X2 [Condylostylus longicornis]|nr:putative uncharacterized protein DDB_G0282133 isoform X2 [Condylostylus longicornis]XP_055378161.1 putative uncharacterized protein DDB_G0282133 isoform X2 [Condylostylus longicornis]